MKKYTAILSVLILVYSCCPNTDPIVLPTLTTTIPTLTIGGNASSGGNITDSGDGVITARGVVWGTSSSPTISLATKTVDGTGSGLFTSAITGLVSGTTYYVRAYATNGSGTAYGNEITFTETAVPLDGLIGYWPFNGNANDESGNGNNGTVNGATLTTDRFGNDNSCYNFNYNGLAWNLGLHQVINMPFNASYNSNSITVSIWFFARNYFFSGIPGTDKISRLVSRYQYGYNNPNGQAWGIDLWNNQVRAFVLEPSTANDQSSVLSSANVSLNQWNHVAFTFDNTSLKLYLNGALFSETPKPPTFFLNTNGNSGISVGCSNQANGYWYESDAKIDKFGFWNRALTQAEITALYNSTGK